jgi:putative transcriptional regulator
MWWIRSSVTSYVSASIVPMTQVQNIVASVKRPRIFLAIAVMVVALSAGTASSDDSNFLVARPQLGDSLFEQSVILMLPHGAIPMMLPPAVIARVVDGVIINKPTTIGVKKAFPHSVDLPNAADVIYFGGPVELDATLMVRRTSSPTQDEHQIFGDLYLSVDPNNIATILKDPRLDKENVRVLQGYSQWDIDQLHDEKARGSWYEVPVNADAVFSTSPAHLWDELVAKGRVPEVEPPSPGGGSLLKILELPPNSIEQSFPPSQR